MYILCKRSNGITVGSFRIASSDNGLYHILEEDRRFRIEDATRYHAMHRNHIRSQNATIEGYLGEWYCYDVYEVTEDTWNTRPRKLKRPEIIEKIRGQDYIPEDVSGQAPSSRPLHNVPAEDTNWDKLCQ